MIKSKECRGRVVFFKLITVKCISGQTQGRYRNCYVFVSFSHTKRNEGKSKFSLVFETFEDIRGFFHFHLKIKVHNKWLLENRITTNLQWITTYLIIVCLLNLKAKRQTKQSHTDVKGSKRRIEYCDEFAKTFCLFVYQSELKEISLLFLNSPSAWK